MTDKPDNPFGATAEDIVQVWRTAERARVVDWIEYNLRQSRRGSKEAQILATLRNQVEGGEPAPQGRLV